MSFLSLYFVLDLGKELILQFGIEIVGLVLGGGSNLDYLQLGNMWI